MTRKENKFVRRRIIVKCAQRIILTIPSFYSTRLFLDEGYILEEPVVSLNNECKYPFELCFRVNKHERPARTRAREFIRLDKSSIADPCAGAARRAMPLVNRTALTRVDDANDLRDLFECFLSISQRQRRQKRGRSELGDRAPPDPEHVAGSIEMHLREKSLSPSASGGVDGGRRKKTSAGVGRRAKTMTIPSP
ncbi:hypothetical protein EVAR_4978_1 [Eumeta japonica]|uniref:Uncharacterized protein n=1 Tax=Eumeta variegata TaxID=151549 RepID=A0A4C1UZR6_EUMVA|nr:hypothetical protein EVAR_4978_1 [Eumeta japonica]